MNMLKTIMANKHTSAAGVVFLVCTFATNVGCTWFPNSCEKIKQTAEATKALAVGYGLLMANDGKKDDQTPTTPK